MREKRGKREGEKRVTYAKSADALAMTPVSFRWRLLSISSSIYRICFSCIVSFIFCLSSCCFFVDSAAATRKRSVK